MPDPGSAPKRFYTRADAVAGEGGFVLALDGRPARTPGRALLALPTLALAEAVAKEWNAQGASIDAASMPVTRLANTAIDGVAATLTEVRDDIARYAGSDLVLYRAGDPDRLVADQAAAWDPVLAWARDELQARFILREGLMFVEQPAASIARIRNRLESEASPFALAALHVMTTLTGSALIALMHAAGRLDLEAAWQAAHADELFQESRWGADDEAVARRAHRKAEFATASRMLELGRG